VREVWCPACDVSVRGHFAQCEFCALPEEQLNFLRLFVARRGNLREVERELGISYPTVRARLDELLRALDYVVTVGSPILDRREHKRQVMEELREGRVTPQEALDRLRE
jgi:hypothetical protein